MSALIRLAKEPPFRLVAAAWARYLPFSIRTKAMWDAVARPNYLTGVLYAADEARAQNVEGISVIEFGVAGGAGLLALQDYANRVEVLTDIKIAVYGFDSGKGLPRTCGDYRDHPDRYSQGEYQMDHAALSHRLASRTSLVLGDVADTVPSFIAQGSYPPIGFIAVDLDLYSSSKEALQVLTLPGKRMLHRVPIYFDDVDASAHHRWAGELLAIQEFNERDSMVKIDRWRGIQYGRPFPEHDWLSRMYMAHDLAAISSVPPHKELRELPIPHS